jgi:hypothetical protein
MYRQSQQESPAEKQKGMGMIEAFKSCLVSPSPWALTIYFFSQINQSAVADFETAYPEIFSS